MKVTIITVCYNSEETVQRTIESVLQQDYQNIEYIIIDGKSSDQTISIINNYKNKISRIISEKDRSMYDALNKGIEIATGDIIGLLHSDDYYPKSNILSVVSSIFRKCPEIGIVIGDVAYIDKKDNVRRSYSGKKFNFGVGIMPPHPAVFIKKECYEKYGNFNIDYKIAADYELLFKLIQHHQLKYEHSSDIIVHMSIGGLSNKNIFSSITLNKEIHKIHKALGDPISLYSLLKKIPKRLKELVFWNFFVAGSNNESLIHYFNLNHFVSKYELLDFFKLYFINDLTSNKIENIINNVSCKISNNYKMINFLLRKNLKWLVQ